MASNQSVLEFVREDDFVEYFLFPKIGADVSADQEENVLKNCSSKVKEIVERLSKNYIWHKDSFVVKPRSRVTNILVSESENNRDTLPPHLYGVLHYGENIEDEWFLVFLLYQLTKEIDLIVRIVDSDGEFLLIEAAEHLPEWANPERCDKRVYIYKGSLHIIPKHLLDGDTESAALVHKAIDAIFSSSGKTTASNKIQKCIKERIKGYPGKISESLHRSTVYLPVGIAAILKHKPNLIAPAITAFCNRDSFDLKACRMMRYFPPENRVLTSVLFTKCLYAMLIQNKYVPDKRTGWNLPAVSGSDYKAHILGIKIACGFEILISQAKSSQDLDGDKNWHRYLNSLKEKNYFQGLLEHSKDYNKLLNKAKEFYTEHRESMYVTPIIGQEILGLTKSLNYNIEELKLDENNIPKGDDESWLNIEPEELDKMLEERYGQKNVFSSNGNADEKNFTNKLAEFLDHVSGIEGAEFPESKPPIIEQSSDSPPVRPKRGAKRNSGKGVTFSKDTNVDSPKHSTAHKVNFDPNGFSCAVQNILDFVIPDDSWDLESGSEMSDYENDAELTLDEKMTNDVNAELKRYMDAMDEELATTTIGQSFEKKQVKTETNDSFDDIESFQPVDIDANALKNMLKSYRYQMGEAGPAGNLLEPLGIKMNELNVDEDDE